MKFDKIVAFGDSFVWGDELLDPALVDHPHAHPVLMENTAYRESQSFPGQIGQHYGVPVENFGWPGGSLQSTIWSYLWWIEHETLPLNRCLVLVGLTDGARTSFYNPRHKSYANDPPWNRFIHSSWINNAASALPQDWIEMGRRHMILTHCQQLIDLNWLQALLFFQGQVTRHADLLQLKTMAGKTIRQEPSLIWPDQDLQTFFDNLPEPNYYLCPMRHPNEKGHRMIADRLILEIDRAILSE